MKKILSVAALLALIASIFAGCSGADVVLKYSPDSLRTIVEKYPDLVTDNSKADNYYYLSFDGETLLKICRDFKATDSDDIVLETPLQPFVDAGLEVSKLGDGYKVSEDTLSLVSDYGDGSGAKDAVVDALFESVKSKRSVLSYHMELDHYGIDLGAGKFEWAKDYTSNDKDLVFVIKAQPLKERGADVENIKGWTFATVKGPDGREVDILLMAYDLDAK